VKLEIQSVLKTKDILKKLGDVKKVLKKANQIQFARLDTFFGNV